MVNVCILKESPKGKSENQLQPYYPHNLVESLPLKNSKFKIYTEENSHDKDNNFSISSSQSVVLLGNP